MKFVKNLAALLVSDAFSKALQFVVLGYLARTLGAEGLGTFLWVQSVLLIFTLAPNFGLNEYGILRVSPDRSKENISRIVSDILAFRVVSGLLGVAVLAAMSFSIPQFVQYRELLIVGSTVLITAIVASDWLFTALENQALIGLYRLIARAVYVAAVLVFVRSSEQVMAAIVCYVAGEAAFSLGLFIHARRSTAWSWISVGTKRLVRVFADAWPFAVLMANSSVLYYIDIVLVGILIPMSEAGVYGGVLRIVGPFITVKYLFGQLIYPKLARRVAHPEESAELMKLTEAINRYGLLMGLVLTSVLLAFSREIVVLVLGTSFVSGWWPFAILSMALFAEFSWISLPYLAICFSPRFYTGIVVLTTVIKVIALVVVVPLAGVQGGAVVYSASTLLVFALSLAYVRSQRVTISVMRFFVWPTALALVMLAAFFFLESIWWRALAWIPAVGLSALYLGLIGQRYSPGSVREDLRIINAG